MEELHKWVCMQKNIANDKLKWETTKAFDIEA